MLKNISFSLILFFVLGLLSCSNVTGTEIEWIYSLDKGLEIAKTENKPIMIDFYTDWCGWCKKLDSDTYSDLGIQELAKSFVCVKLDGDKNRELTSKYGVRGFPTITFLNSEGKEINKNVGYATVSALSAIMESIIKE